MLAVHSYDELNLFRSSLHVTDNLARRHRVERPEPLLPQRTAIYFVKGTGLLL